ncbi:vestitone reductase isoform X4 [Hevea brasiliensis]|uniref:vestitone reductase isoform X4 n=1 Tax=Hevea brasiliensis TaxID=3981 RepID=UPI0025E0BCE7|nr:vestitone reductase isoform X4 [Hevea brasiliensis]
MEADKGKVCVTGGTGFVASWLIMRLLQHGYSAHTTVRPGPEHKRDVSFLTSLPGASKKLQIFQADLSIPESFESAIKGCIGVFHVATPVDFENKEPEEVIVKRTIDGTLGILKACLNSKTVKRVVYTSSASTIVFSDKVVDTMDEGFWSNVDYIKSINYFTFGPYMISKTSTEKIALEFAEEHGLDLVTVIPSFIVGPFICPKFPGSVHTSMAMILEKGYSKAFQDKSKMRKEQDYESQDSKKRSLKGIEGYKTPGVSPKKLLDSGFEFKYGLDEMFDEAIQCCKEKGYL